MSSQLLEVTTVISGSCELENVKILTLHLQNVNIIPYCMLAFISKCHYAYVQPRRAASVVVDS